MRYTICKRKKALLGKEMIKMSAIKLTTENFDREVLSSDKPVLVDFWAEWCGPCRMMSPIIDEIADTEPAVKVCKVNVDESGELSARFNIMSIPTLMVFKDGKPVNTAVGARSKAAVLAMLNS